MSDPPEPGGSPAERVAIVDEQDRPLDLETLASFAERALDAAGVPPGHALSVALVGRRRIADLAGRYRGERRPTDVLAFPMDPLDAPAPASLGDVVICPAVAERQARGLGLPLEREVEHLLVHGILHLTGRDHADPASEVAMAREERRVLRAARRARRTA